MNRIANNSSCVTIDPQRNPIIFMYIFMSFSWKSESRI